MSSIDAPSHVSGRYSRALRFSGPKLAARSTAIGVEGYWLADDLFYFLAERWEPSIERMVAIPSIADCNTGRVEAVITLEDLAELMTAHTDVHIDLQALASAEFAMQSRDRLSVRVAGLDATIDIGSRRILEAKTSMSTPALFSPDGRYACFVKGHDLWVQDCRGGQARALTTDGEPNHAYGQQPETALAAVTYRSRPSPVGLWSPDSDWFFTHCIDERSLPDLTLLQSVLTSGGRPVARTFKYAMPGDPAPVATYVAIHVATSRVVAFPEFRDTISAFSPFALGRIWFSGADTVWFVRVDRFSRQADLIRLDLSDGTGRVVLSESAPAYLDLNPLSSRIPNVRVLTASSEVIWFSERDGWGHLYLYDAASGACKGQITRGAWQVRDIVHVDEASRRILFLAGGVEAETDPARRSLCAVNLDGSNFEVLARHDGDVSVPVSGPSGFERDRPFVPPHACTGMSPDGRFAVVRYGSIDRGNHTDIVDFAAHRRFIIAESTPSLGDPISRRFTALAADGSTRLHGVMFLPSDFDEAQCYPLVDFIYPGPQIAQQPQSFNSLRSAPALALAELGFVTIMLDTRGSPLGSRSYRQAAYGSLLEPQLADHAAVVRQLIERHRYIDGDNVGILGQSGGGAAAARALCDYGDVFKVAVAVCGNHDSNLYSTAWSDKYRGPGKPETWLAQANGAVAAKLRGKLLLISGDMDENVHVSHTLALVDSLIGANKDFDLLIVPNAGHDVLITNGYVERRAWDYFVRNLRRELPPVDFEIRFEAHELARFRRNRARELQH